MNINDILRQLAIKDLPLDNGTELIESFAKETSIQDIEALQYEIMLYIHLLPEKERLIIKENLDCLVFLSDNILLRKIAEIYDKYTLTNQSSEQEYSPTASNNPDNNNLNTVTENAKPETSHIDETFYPKSASEMTPEDAENIRDMLNSRCFNNIKQLTQANIQSFLDYCPQGADPEAERAANVQTVFNSRCSKIIKYVNVNDLDCFINYSPERQNKAAAIKTVLCAKCGFQIAALKQIKIEGRNALEWYFDPRVHDAYLIDRHIQKISHFSYRSLSTDVKAKLIAFACNFNRNHSVLQKIKEKNKSLFDAIITMIDVNKANNTNLALNHEQLAASTSQNNTENPANPDNNNAPIAQTAETLSQATRTQIRSSQPPQNSHSSRKRGNSKTNKIEKKRSIITENTVDAAVNVIASIAASSATTIAATAPEGDSAAVSNSDSGVVNHTIDLSSVQSQNFMPHGTEYPTFSSPQTCATQTIHFIQPVQQPQMYYSPMISAEYYQAQQHQAQMYYPPITPAEYYQALQHQTIRPQQQRHYDPNSNLFPPVHSYNNTHQTSAQQTYEGAMIDRLWALKWQR